MHITYKRQEIVVLKKGNHKQYSWVNTKRILLTLFSIYLISYTPFIFSTLQYRKQTVKSESKTSWIKGVDWVDHSFYSCCLSTNLRLDGSFPALKVKVYMFYMYVIVYV